MMHLFAPGALDDVFERLDGIKRHAMCMIVLLGKGLDVNVFAD